MHVTIYDEHCASYTVRRTLCITVCIHDVMCTHGYVSTRTRSHAHAYTRGHVQCACTRIYDVQCIYDVRRTYARLYAIHTSKSCEYVSTRTRAHARTYAQGYVIPSINTY